MALRPRGQRLTLVVLAALAVAGAVSAAVLKVATAAWLVGLAALLTGVGALWTRQRDQRAAGRGVVRRALAGELLVADADLRLLRAHPAVVDVPYLPRPAKEAEVAGYLRNGEPVLLVGPSMVGKTRLAAQVVKDLYGDRPILVPDSAGALVELDVVDIAPRDHVLWLDDLERFLTAGLTPGLLRRLAAANVVVATLRAMEWDRLQPTDRIRPPEWDALQVFHRVTLDRDRDRPDGEALAAAVPDDTDRERIERIGIGEYVGAAHHIRERIELGPDADPVGFALVLGAVDWHRTGFTRPVPADVLTRLAEPHLDARHRARLAEDHAEALAWATREINPRVSLLEPADGGFTVYDYALDQLVDRVVPAEAWQVAIAEADTDELETIGHQALGQGLTAVAEDAWRRAAAAGSALAKTNVGVLLLNRSELDEAEAWAWRGAADGSTHALILLGEVAERREDPVTAGTWFRRAADAGDSGGMHRLARFLLRPERQDRAAARRWLERAADAGDGEAMHDLAILLADEGQLDWAGHWLDRAASAGAPGALPHLIAYLTDPPAGTDAPTRFRLAAERMPPDNLLNVADLVADLGEPELAERYYRRAAEGGNSHAMLRLGTVLFQRGEPEAAREWLVRWREAVRARDRT
ncbi:MAG: hypothetical protein HOV94_13160 [Saccharothrix sp.]|nr:hypothetical protein [Saccharothrix sp.]